jgi:nitroreductase
LAIRERKDGTQGMNIAEAIGQRKSIRAFKTEPVPKEVLKGIMELALRAPSWEDTQPWGFAVVTGKKLEEIRQAFSERIEERHNPDIPHPREYPQPYDTRRRTLGRKVLELKGISREDREKRKWWGLQGLRSFETPCVIYIYIDRAFYQQGDTLNLWPIFDCGLVAENIMLLAMAHGLGTVAQIQAVAYPDVLRKVLGIPDSKVILLAIAVGYPDWADPVNQLHSEREPLDNVSTWYGFD